MGLLDQFIAKRPQQQPGGDKLDPRAGGAPGLTIQMNKLYQDYQMSAMATGENPIQLEEWLQQQGYQRRPDGMIIPLQPAQPPSAGPR